jgi:hypothetical protein
VVVGREEGARRVAIVAAWEVLGAFVG